MITAVQLANKNPTFNLKFTGRPGVRGGAMEIKRVGLEIEGTTEVTPPDLVTQSAAAKVAAGTQQIGTSEKDQATGAEKETRARVYAAETEFSEEEAMAEITAGIQTELDDPSDPGPTQAIN